MVSFYGILNHFFGNEKTFLILIGFDWSDVHWIFSETELTRARLIRIQVGKSSKSCNASLSRVMFRSSASPLRDDNLYMHWKLHFNKYLYVSYDLNLQLILRYSWNRNSSNSQFGIILSVICVEDISKTNFYVGQNYNP